MNTGENPIPLSEDTQFRLPGKMIAWLVTVGVALGAGVAVAQYRLNLHEVDITELKKKDAARDVSDVGTQKDVEYIKQTLGEINHKLDRMLRNRGVQSAGGTDE